MQTEGLKLQTNNYSNMKTIIYLTSIFISFSINAQIQNNTSRFVEFMIQDSVTIEADKIIYMVNFTYDIYNDDENIENVSKDEMKSRRILTKQTKDLTQKKLIEFANRNRMKFTSIQEKEDNGDIQNDYGDIQLGLLEITNNSNLKNQLEELSKIKHIKHIVIETSSTLEEKATQELTVRIIQKAKEKAQFYAQALQVKVVKILQISEFHPNQNTLDTPYNGGWVVYPPLSTLPNTLNKAAYGIYFQQNNRDTKILLNKAIFFRFEIE